MAAGENALVNFNVNFNISFRFDCIAFFDMYRIPRYQNYSFSIDQMLTLFSFHFKCLQNTVILSILNT